MGLFNPKLQETGGSSVTPKAAPQQPNIIGEVAKTIQSTSSIFAKVGAAKAEGAANTTVAKFNQELARIAEGVNQGVITPQAAATASRTKYSQFVSQHPQLTSEFNKAYKGVNETTDAFNVKETEEQQIRKKVIDLATTQGFVQADMSEQEIEQGLEDFSNWKVAANKLQSLKTKQEYTTAKTKEERRIVDEERKEKSDIATKAYVETRGGAVKSKMASISSEIKNGNIDPSDGSIMIQQEMARFREEVINSGSESDDLIEPLLKSYESLATIYKNMANGTTDTTYAENQVKGLLAKEKSIILADEEDRKVIAGMNLLGNPVSGVVAANKIVTRLMSGNEKAGNGGSNTTIVVGATGEKDYYGFIKKSAKILEAKDSGVDMGGSVEELRTQVNQTLKSIDVFSAATKGAESYNEVVGFISSPEFGKMVNAGLIDKQAALNAQMVIQREYGQVLYPLIQKEIKKVFATHVGVLSGFMDTEVGIEDAVNIDVTSNGVVFRPKANLPMELQRQLPYADMIKKLNGSVGKQMNRIIRMDSHFVGTTDYRAIGEQTLSQLLGNEKQEAKEVAPSAPTPETLNKQAKASGVDLSGYADGDYEDGSGIIVTIKGGKIVGVK